MTASTAATVSPAPDTSRTLTENAGTWIDSVRVCSNMPSSLSVTRIALLATMAASAFAAAAISLPVPTGRCVASASPSGSA